MVSRELMEMRERLASVVYSLIDEYYRYGHLYDDDGDVKEKYRYIYCQEDGLLYDSEGKALDYIPQKYDQDYDFALDVHNCEAMGQFSYKEIVPMPMEVILDKYLVRSKDKLVAMLMRGRNYASRDPFPKYFDRGVIEQTIAMTWKLMVISTLDCIDFKRKLKGMYGPNMNVKVSADPVWDERHFGHRLFGEEDCIVSTGPLNLRVDEDWFRSVREANAKRLKAQKEIQDVIERSYSDEFKAERLSMFEALKAEGSDSNE